MTDTVASQAAYLALAQPGAVVSTETVYLAITSVRMEVTAQTAYLALIDETPPTGRRRQIVIS
ncbi:hypothetical protein NUH86_01805 [Sphingobium sp. JS3065]|uniref:hypothetical protein n=1 Tax=Sphingobium sp. JS3065 TaxID=2970925 RepID=UPI002264E396|nr:hypothetical protein [Sphingobium sp. JS3065]UZW55566.1 hypothetical protein NUH86_01805 [Sphingobium sp. JS3065]